MKTTITLITITAALALMIIRSAAETLAATLNPPAKSTQLIWDPTR